MAHGFVHSSFHRSLPLLAVLTAAAVPSGLAAQTFIPVPEPVYETPKTSKPSPAKSSPSGPQLADQKMIPCPSYGPGFFRQTGSSVCLKVSGQVRIETGIVDRRSRLEPATGSNVRAGLGLETMTPTEYGTFRTVVVTRGLVVNGNIVPAR